MERTLSEELIVTSIGVAKGTNADRRTLVPAGTVYVDSGPSTSSSVHEYFVANTVPVYEQQLENRVEHLTHANVELAKDRAFYKIAFQVLLFIDVLYIVWSFIL